MRGAVWLNVLRANTDRVDSATSVTTPVPHVWMQGLPTVPAVTQVGDDTRRSFLVSACVQNRWMTNKGGKNPLPPV